MNCLYKSSVSVSSHNFLLNLQFFKFPLPNNFSAAVNKTSIYSFQSWFWQKLKIDTNHLLIVSYYFLSLDTFSSQNVLLNLQFFKFPMQYNFCAKCTLTRPVWRIYPFQSWFWQNEECFCTQSHLNRFKTLPKKKKKSSGKIIELQNWALHESVVGHRHKCIKEQFCEIKVVKKKLCCITNSRVKLCVIYSYFFSKT